MRSILRFMLISMVGLSSLVIRASAHTNHQPPWYKSESFILGIVATIGTLLVLIGVYFIFSQFKAQDSEYDSKSSDGK